MHASRATSPIRAFLEQSIDDETASVFHLAAVVSGQAEADFDLGMRVNFDSTRLLLEVCRARGHRPRVVFASSCAVYGGELPAIVPRVDRADAAVVVRHAEGDGRVARQRLHAARFIDGRALRLPTISVRPGKPNAALSSFASGIIREPLNGEVSVCPVPADTRVWMLSPATVIDCFIAAHEIAGERSGANRSLMLPGLTVSVGEMVASLERVAGPAVAAGYAWSRTLGSSRIVNTWPVALDASRALRARLSHRSLVRGHREAIHRGGHAEGGRIDCV